MGKEVFCWNEYFGCNAIMTASEVSKHFHHDCVHHMASCTKCATEIIASDVCAHLESQCGISRVSSANAVLPRQIGTPGDAPQVSSSNAKNAIHQMVTSNSVATTSIEAQLKEIGRVVRVGASSATGDDRKTGEKNELERLLQEAVSEMKVQMTEEKDHFEEFMQTVTASLQTFQNSLTEKNVELIQILNGAEHSERGQSNPSLWLTAFREAMLDYRRETKAELDRLSAASDSQCREIGGMSRKINALKQTLNEVSNQIAARNARLVAPSLSRTSSATNDHSGDTRNVFARILSAMPLGTKHRWVLKVNAVRSALGHLAYLSTYVDYLSSWYQPVYLRGYKVSVGAYIDDGALKFCVKLHKGEIDEFLEWPFQLKMMFSILHPQTNDELQHCVAPNLRLEESFSRPLEASNRTVFIGCDSFACKNLERRGFIKDNQIILCFSIEDEKTATK